MCRTYGSGNGAYVRACYRTGHRGTQIPASQAVWRGEHLDLSGSGTGPAQRPIGVMQHYRVPRARLESVLAQAIERYRPLNTPAPVEIAGSLYVSFHLKRAWPEMSTRMSTFGWQAVPHMDGLPTPPMREVRPRRGRGRACQWALVVVFDEQPSPETLAAITEAADDDAPRRDFYQSRSGRWVRHAFRDQGWTQEEWNILWTRIRELGGREWQPGDDPIG